MPLTLGTTGFFKLGKIARDALLYVGFAARQCAFCVVFWCAFTARKRDASIATKVPGGADRW